MVGVALAMMIATMHEKSCIDLQNARKVIFILRNRNDETAKIESLRIS